MRLADLATRNRVSQFIFASSGSVYGVKDEPSVTEDLSLVPISEYNKTKMVAERVMLSYSDKMIIQCVRPATVCGVSPRMRLDLSVNLLTMQALTQGKITVLGGNQTRPNIHIQDMIGVYLHFLGPGKNATGIFNAGFENMSIMDIAKLVTKHVKAEIVVKESNDPRSYRLNSDKLLKTGFKPSFSVEKAIVEVVEGFRTGQIKDEDQFYNIRWMKKNYSV
jgi:nucleoside-diphosphate-sugar epimerase